MKQLKPASQAVPVSQTLTASLGSLVRAKLGFDFTSDAAMHRAYWDRVWVMEPEQIDELKKDEAKLTAFIVALRLSR